MRTMARVFTGLLVLLISADVGRAEEKLTPEERAQLEKEAQELTSRASQLYQGGRVVEATDLAVQALEKRRVLFPKSDFPQGHLDLAASLNNLGVLLKARGEYGTAESLQREALAMRRALYPKATFPDGHPRLVASLNNLAHLFLARGDYGQAEPLCREALDRSRALTLRFATDASAADALNLAHSLPLVRDGYLSFPADRTDPATVYAAVWPSRAALSRVEERRHRDALASQDPAVADLFSELRGQRDRLAYLLWHPGKDADAHRREVDKLTEEKEDLERRLAALLRIAAPTGQKEILGPRELLDRLPDGVAFLDLVRYTRFTYDPDKPGKVGQKWTQRYVAFVLVKGRSVVRVDLEATAADIDKALAAWRLSIVENRADERRRAPPSPPSSGNPSASTFRTNSIFFTSRPDGALARVPWAALPGRQPDTVLLEESAVALVPHGLFLFDRLPESKQPRPVGSAALVLGGVDYGKPQTKPAKGLLYGPLPGTEAERVGIAGLARQHLKSEPTDLSGQAASGRAVGEALATVRYAHLATHGFYAADDTLRDAGVDHALFQSGYFDRQAGARSPLLRCGLVLAGHNLHGEQAPPDGGLLTGEAVLGLRLNDLELAVLSACESGLGEIDDRGEGAFALSRAFHIAGARHVVSSLWSVDDQATYALMLLLYRKLWVDGQEPLVALRTAQLELYRRPELIAELGKRRGDKLVEVDWPELAQKPGEKGKKAPVSAWAAFTFSGTRR